MMLRSMMYHVVFAITLLLFLAITPALVSAAAYDARSYADSVFSYTVGTQVSQEFMTSSNALGQEDNSYVSLGNNGELIVEFTDNGLVGDGGIWADLAILDAGAGDGIYVYISRNAEDWLYVGFGNVSGWQLYDINRAEGFQAGVNYRYVKIVDDGNTDTGYPTGGVDVDAVATYNYNPVPLPGAGFLLLSGLAGLFGIRRKVK